MDEELKTVEPFQPDKGFDLKSQEQDEDKPIDSGTSELTDKE